MTVKRRDFQKIATTIHQFLLKLTDTYECAELRDSLNMTLLQLQKYYRKCQQRLQHTGRHNSDQSGSGYVSPRQSLRITLSRSSEALSPMTPYIEEPQYFHAHWTVLDEKSDEIRKSLSQENLSSNRSINTPPVHYAATKSDFELLNVLFTEKKDVLEDQDCLGRTPLMYAVYYNQIDVVRWLLERGADPNSCDLSEITSLHWACFKGNVRIIELLLEAGANINCQDSFGRSASHWACTCSSLEPLQLLIEYDTKINLHDRNGLTPTMWACRLDNLAHVTMLSKVKNQEIDHIDGYERDRNGRTIIHWSIRRQQPLECLKFLLNEQTVQLKDDEGKSVMLLASEQGALETCKVIIEKFGSKYLEDIDDDDRTSLILATNGGHGEVVNFLLENGANLKWKDKSGASCMDISRNQYLFYCQLIISSHVREMERRRESIPSDCVELIEKATSRHNSIVDARALLKSPPKPPTSPKSPTLKRRLIKYVRDPNLDHDEEMPNGFDAMSSDSFKISRKSDMKDEEQSNRGIPKPKNPSNQPNVSKSLDNMQYQEPETLDFLDNDTGHQYHGSYEYLKSQRSIENPTPDDFVDNLSAPSTERSLNPKPLHRAKKINKIHSAIAELLKTPSVGIPLETPDNHELKEDKREIHSISGNTRSAHQHSGPIDPAPKINYGASLEPINKNFSNDTAPRKKKKKPKEQRMAAKSQDRLEHLKLNKQMPNLENQIYAKSLENISNKLVQLPNGIVSKRLQPNVELFPISTRNQDQRNSTPLTGELRQNEREGVLEKPSAKHIPPLEALNSNWLKHGVARF